MELEIIVGGFAVISYVFGCLLGYWAKSSEVKTQSKRKTVNLTKLELLELLHEMINEDRQAQLTGEYLSKNGIRRLVEIYLDEN